ncbi:MAG: cyclic nucleotide-binding domain-containing protein, partial [Gammaproteobacteria bacterium]|nr:cyclic nucleotide-binding domain-containing protein [Gammaproteobacteria bacterium]
MSVEKKLIDKAILKTLVPCDALSDENLAVLAKTTFVASLSAGEVLFKSGQCDSLRYYLLSGELQLDTPGQAAKLLRGEATAKHHALAHNQPRQVSATAKSAVAVAIVDEDELGTMLTWDQSAGYRGDDTADEVELRAGAGAQDDDWMTRILQTKSFYRVPPANIQAMFMRLQPAS